MKKISAGIAPADVLGFTGTRKGLTPQQHFVMGQFLRFNRITTVIHGDCIGADAEFDAYARAINVPSIEIYPSNLKDQRAKTFHVLPSKKTSLMVHEAHPPLVRNHLIVNEADHMIACPGEQKEVLRSGTWATIRYAKRLGKSLNIIYPDGTVEDFNFKFWPTNWKIGEF